MMFLKCMIHILILKLTWGYYKNASGVPYEYVLFDVNATDAPDYIILKYINVAHAKEKTKLEFSNVSNPFIVKRYADDQNEDFQNESYYNGTDDYMNQTSYEEYLNEIRNFIFPKTWTWVLICFHFVVFAVGLVGNTLVCVAVYRNHSMRTVTNYFIVNLALADFLVILFCLPPTVIWDVTLTWFFGIAMCKIVLYLQILLFTFAIACNASKGDRQKRTLYVDNHWKNHPHVITNHIGVPYLQPYPVHVEKQIPYPVPVVKHIDRHYPVHFTKEVVRPYPVVQEVHKPYPVHITKEIDHPYPVEVIKHIPYKVPEYIKVPHEVKVPVEKPYPVHVPVKSHTHTHTHHQTHTAQYHYGPEYHHESSGIGGYVSSGHGGIGGYGGHDGHGEHGGHGGYNTYSKEWKW